MANPENLIGHGFNDHPERINKEGKPKGARNRQTIYREHLEKVGKAGKVVDDLVLAAIEKALTGDITALKELMDSGYGKVPDKSMVAEVAPEDLERDVTDEAMKHIPTEVLEELAKKNESPHS